MKKLIYILLLLPFAGWGQVSSEKYATALVSAGSWSYYGTSLIQAIGTCGDEGSFANHALKSGTAEGTGFTINDFDYAIPSGATVAGVKLSVYFAVSNATATGYIRARISIDGGSTWSSYTAYQSVNATAYAYKYYGGDSDVWGLTIAASDINSTDFQVEISGYLSLNYILRVGCVSATVYYNEPDNPQNIFFWHNF